MAKPSGSTARSAWGHAKKMIAPAYLDRTLCLDRRVADLMSRMTVEDKVGLMFQPIAVVGNPAVPLTMLDLPSPQSMIAERKVTHFSLAGSAPSGRGYAEWHNALQEIAAGLPLRIPVTLSSDPRHSFTDNPAAAAAAGPFSQWPEALGLAAIGSEEVVARFADIARREYVAAGLRVALHPQIDLATEPRWCRINGTFGEDSQLTSRLAIAYIRGFQGTQLGPDSVSTMVKHFPGGGPQKDGEDPHFPYGREQIYPGNNFEYHLKPFEAAIAAGASQVMPYYGMPLGTQYEEVGFAFNRSVITGLLRERYRFDGIVCADWSIISDSTIFGQPIAARAWGVESLSRAERLLKAIDAGVDQFGGEHCTDVLLPLVLCGRISETRIDESVRRLLREKFVLGLFDNPYVDADRAETVIGNAEFREAGLAAQRQSLTLLTNTRRAEGPVLPLKRSIAVYAEGLDLAVLADYATVASDPAHADVAILRVKAPYEPRAGSISQYFRAGSLEFSASELNRLRTVCDAVPTVIDIYLDRPAVIGPLVQSAAAVIANYGASDVAVLDVLFGAEQPNGRLPFDIPRSIRSVVESKTDVPFDTVDPLFRFGHGLSY
jgi:beta-glucosidase